MRLCNYDNCYNNHYALGFCKKHYQRYHKYGDPSFTVYGRDMEKHGMFGTPEYCSWSNMKKRCNDPTNKYYSYYGGRGITVCDRWNNSFLAFFNDMGLKPFPKAQIDRIDNNGNYNLDNCHWVNQTANIRNASNTKLSMPIARAIREIYKTCNSSQKKISIDYNISESTVQKICANEYWKENAV